MDKKERSVNWRDCEIRTLLDQVDMHKDYMFASFTNSWTSKKKDALWKQITGAINARGEAARRTTSQVKKKWSNIRSRAIQAKNELKKVPTGGGPMTPTEWWVDVVLNIVGVDNEVVTGIDPNGGGESGVVPNIEGLAEDSLDQHNPWDNEDADSELDELTIVYQQVDGIVSNTDALLQVIPIAVDEENENASSIVESQSLLASTPKEKHQVKKPRLDTGAVVNINTSSSSQGRCRHFSLEKGGAAQASAGRSGRPSSAPAGPSNAPAGPSNAPAGPSGRSTTTNNPATAPATLINRLDQLKNKRKRQLSDEAKQETTKIAKDRKTVGLVDAELDKIKKQSALYDTEQTLRKLQQTNAKLEQVKLYYEIKKLELELRIPPDQHVGHFIQLDVDLSRDNDESSDSI
ncbi:hypothetical protein V1264_019846 [Littorina saxatilis]|uniref:Myb/SANT-like DNA-binding domain-containing protein n=2 Tax=Littorina saxatilis TaxID=31220 RepID=A0AAN9GC47_9CAEN